MFRGEQQAWGMSKIRCVSAMTAAVQSGGVCAVWTDPGVMNRQRRGGFRIVISGIVRFYTHENVAGSLSFSVLRT